MKLKELRAFPNEVADGYGIEVEVEGVNLPDIRSVYWEIHQDGSLRGEAYEYVTKGALPIEKVENAFKILNNAFDKKGSVLNLSFRTSVHVHMNVRELEISKIGAVIYLYYLFEEPLMQLCGDDRIGNRFCLRLRDSEEIINNILNAFNGKFQRLDEGQLKYSALNIAPIRTFGSLEFRGMKGTVDTEYINIWVNLLNCLKTSPFDTAKDVYAFLTDNGAEQLAQSVFGEWFKYIRFEGWERDVARNASLAIELPHRIAEIKAPKRNELVDDAVRKMEVFLGMPPPEPRMQQQLRPVGINEILGEPVIEVRPNPAEWDEADYDEEEEF